MNLLFSLIELDSAGQVTGEKSCVELLSTTCYAFCVTFHDHDYKVIALFVTKAQVVVTSNAMIGARAYKISTE